MPFCADSTRFLSQIMWSKFVSGQIWNVATFPYFDESDTKIRFIFSSSLAVFGGDLPEIIQDSTAVTPQSTYGAQKAMSELLINDYTRKGFVDGLCVRLPTICIRPGKPNKAASSFVSSIIREPLHGETSICQLLKKWQQSQQ